MGRGPEARLGVPSVSPLRPCVGVAKQHLDFGNLAQWATATSAAFGHFSDLECEQMKNRLLDLEDIEREDGRVGGTRSWPEPRPDLQKLRHT